MATNPTRFSLRPDFNPIPWESGSKTNRYSGIRTQCPTYCLVCTTPPDAPYDDKTIAEYEKGFRYGTNKDKLDEALENAVLKSELFGEPSAINQYRYYGTDDKKRKRRDAKRLRFDGRNKRQVDLTPEEILALLSLYENNRQRHEESDNYRQPWNRFEPNFELDSNQDDTQDLEEENWLDNPVYPHASAYDKEMGPKYMVEQNTPQIFEKKGRWGGFGDNRNKRFMVSKKRSSDPTREIRYLNGPNRNDFYTLSQLLSNQREPNMIAVYFLSKISIYTKQISRPNHHNTFEQSPLHFAVKLGDLNLINTLLENGAEVNIIDTFGNSPLSLACVEKHDINIVKLLLHYNADVNFQRLDHLDLLLECVLNCRTKTEVEIIRILLRADININATETITNRNCLHYAAMTGYLPVAELLLKKGAILNIRDNFNFTPIKMAKIYKNKDVLKLFNAYMQIMY
ncbi:hypothetical protein NQ317_015719 [Molorchus minor]|uniref:Uncharacterized protein n=1 Tax=Molorchus minor TaxID=1323400 RepID=A0ABQ9JLY5_9CUCU|nr:hypothetical protein NQ317_015719 [Molorchus minor]